MRFKYNDYVISIDKLNKGLWKVVDDNGELVKCINRDGWYASIKREHLKIYLF